MSLKTGVETNFKILRRKAPTGNVVEEIPEQVQEVTVNKERPSLGMSFAPLGINRRLDTRIDGSDKTITAEAAFLYSYVKVCARGLKYTILLSMAATQHLIRISLGFGPMRPNAKTPFPKQKAKRQNPRSEQNTVLEYHTIDPLRDLVLTKNGSQWDPEAPCLAGSLVRNSQHS